MLWVVFPSVILGTLVALQQGIWKGVGLAVMTFLLGMLALLAGMKTRPEPDNRGWLQKGRLIMILSGAIASLLTLVKYDLSAALVFGLLVAFGSGFLLFLRRSAPDSNWFQTIVTFVAIVSGVIVLGVLSYNPNRDDEGECEFGGTRYVEC